MYAGEILAHEIAAFLLLENLQCFLQIFYFKSCQKFLVVILINLITHVYFKFFKGITRKSICFDKTHQ